jgi:Sec-independent protein secretion pathway component TatC
MASGGGQTSGSGSLRSDAGSTLGAFLLGFVLAWSQRHALLEWSIEPFLRIWMNYRYAPQPLAEYPPPSLFLTYLSLATEAGFVAALPFSARLCSRIRPSVRAKLSGFRFVMASYLATTAGVVLARYVVASWAADWLKDQSTSLIVIALTDIVKMVITATVGLVLLLKVGVIAATSWTRRGM